MVVLALGKWWAHLDSNQAQPDYESLANNQPQLTTTKFIALDKVKQEIFNSHWL